MSQEVENIKSIVQTASNSFLRVVIKNVTSHYDKMNRLTDIYLGTTHSQIVYDPVLPNLNSGATSISICNAKKTRFLLVFPKNTIFATEKNILP